MAHPQRRLEVNERVKLLAEQAWVYQVRVLNEPDGSRTYTEKEKVFDKEKFAELIVRECAEYAEHELDMAGYKKKFMLKHFGVEE